MLLTCIIILTLQSIVTIFAKVGILIYSIVMIGNIDVSMNKISKLFDDNPLDQHFDASNFIPSFESIIQVISMGMAYMMLGNLFKSASKRTCMNTNQNLPSICKQFCIFNEHHPKE